MNEMLQPLAMCENFSFSEIERNNSKESKETVTNMEDSDSVDSNISHFNGIDNYVESGSDTDVTELNSDSVTSDGSVLHENLPHIAHLSTQDIPKESNACANYSAVSVNIENTTKTTVFNSRFNIITQSTVRDVKKEFIFNSLNSPDFTQDPFDKSRVVVQVLTSNAKSRAAIGNQKCSETPNVRSFRDDVCRMLSKGEPIEIKSNESNSVNMIEDRNSSKELELKSNESNSVNMIEDRNFSKELELKSNESNSVNMIEDRNSSKELELKSNKSDHIRSRRKRSLKFFFLNGKGVELSEIKYVTSNLKNAKPSLLRILHYLLFNTYGSCSNGFEASQTMRNILHFCGYPFNRDSEEFERKKTGLLRLPFPVLLQIYKAVIGNNLKNRLDMVTELIEFLMEPKDLKPSSSNFKKIQEDFATEDYTELLNNAITNPLPSVLVKKLNDCEIEKLRNQLKSKRKDINADTEHDYEVPIDVNRPRKKLKLFPESFEKPSNFGGENTEAESNEIGNGGDQSVSTTINSSENYTESDYQLPMYILNGPGKKLKSFPKIAKNIQDATRKIVELLHFILYGRMEPVEICRKNILEFSGYLPCQKVFIDQARTMLIKLPPAELSQLCEILCLRAITNTRSRKIEKIMKYLSAPSQPLKRRGVDRAKKWNYSIASCFKNPSSFKYESTKIKTSRKSKKRRCEKAESNGIVNEDNHCVSTTANISVHSAVVEETQTGTKLRDFSKICSNIECAAPLDLMELNDLLFIKPSDEPEIHQKILDFTGFKFSTNSIEYHYRKTLMHYMGFCILRKIAQLLDVENWEKAFNQEDLSSNILNFLMEMKPPVSHSTNAGFPKVVTENNLLKRTEFSKECKKKLDFLKETTESVKENKKEEQEEEIIASAKENVKEQFPKEILESLKENNKNVDSQKKIVTPQYFQSQKGKSKQYLSFLNRTKHTKRILPAGLPHSPETYKNSNDVNEILRQCKTGVFIHKITKTSEQSQSIIEKRNDSSVQDDSTPLCSFIHHPSEEEIKRIIWEIIERDLWDSTLGDLVKKVYCYFPKINLHYREDFIKNEARQIIAQMRSNALDTLNNLLIMQSS